MKNEFPFYYVIVFLLIFASCTTSKKPEESICARSNYEKALSYNLSDSIQVDSAMMFFDLALSCESISDSLEGDIYLYLGDFYYYNNIDTAIELYHKALNIWENSPDSLLDRMSLAYNYLGYSYYFTRDFDKCKVFYRKNIAVEYRLIEKYGISNKRLQNLSFALSSLGNYYGELPDYQEQLSLFLQGLQYALSQDEDHNKPNEDKIRDTLLLNLYENVAAGYYYLSEYELSEDYFNKAFKLLEVSSEVLPRHEIDLFLKMSVIYGERNLVDLQNYWLDRAFSVMEGDTSLSEKVVIDIYLGQASALMHEERWSSAKDLLDSLFHTFPSIHKNDEQRWQSLFNIGLCNIHTSNYSEAMRILNELELFLLPRMGKKHPNMSALYGLMGQCQRKKGDGQQALYFYKKALSANHTLAFQDTTRYPSINPTHYLSDFYMLSNLSGILLSYDLMAGEKATSEEMERVLGYSNLLRKALFNVRQTAFDGSKGQYLTEKMLPIFEVGIKTSQRLFHKTNEARYLDSAFQFFQSVKAISLLENINHRYALKLADIPSDQLQKEKSLNETIVNLRYKIRQATLENSKLSVAKINALFPVLEESYFSYDSLIHDWYKRYPNFKQLHEIQLLSVDEIRARLVPQKQVMVEYFMGEEKMHALVTTSEETNLISFDLPSDLELSIRALRKAPSGQGDWVNVSYQLYQSIFEPIKSLCTAEELIIIPDGSLFDLSFESLITEYDKLSSADQDFATHPYLIKTYKISYAPSASFWSISQELKRRSNKKGVLAIAPPFNVPPTPPQQVEKGFSLPITSYFESFPNLPHSQASAIAVANQFNGTSLVEDAASETNFRKELSDHSILYLASHGVVNESAPMLSWVALSSSDVLKKDQLEENGVLYTHEIFELDMGLNLAIISACHSGWGPLKKGEGIMSLARGFIQGGCQSLVVNIWEAEDFTSSKIVQLFVDHVAAGESIDNALRMAKLEFISSLEKGNQRQHPYYWAGMTLLGNTQPIRL